MEKPHASNLRKGRFSQEFGLYLITKSLAPGGSLSQPQRTDVCTALLHLRDRSQLLLHAFVAMPDHWHSLFSLGDSLSLEQAIYNIGRHTSFRTRRDGGRMDWQPGYHDRKVRMGDSVVEIVRYIEWNPVEAGLVEHPSQWRWSSAHAEYRDLLDRGFLGPERWADKG